MSIPAEEMEVYLKTIAKEVAQAPAQDAEEEHRLRGQVASTIRNLAAACAPFACLQHVTAVLALLQVKVEHGTERDLEQAIKEWFDREISRLTN